jgi:hypothetical protein
VVSKPPPLENCAPGVRTSPFYIRNEDIEKLKSTYTDAQIHSAMMFAAELLRAVGVDLGFDEGRE